MLLTTLRFATHATPTQLQLFCMLTCVWHSAPLECTIKTGTVNLVILVAELAAKRTPNSAPPVTLPPPFTPSFRVPLALISALMVPTRIPTPPNVSLVSLLVSLVQAPPPTASPVTLK